MSHSARKQYSTQQTIAQDIPALFITFFTLLSALYIPRIEHSFLLLIGLLIIPGQLLSLKIRLPFYQSAWNIITLIFILAMLTWHYATHLPAQAVLGYICLFLLVHRWYTQRKTKEHLEIWALSTMVLLAAGMELKGLIGLTIVLGWSISTIQLFNLRSVFHSTNKIKTASTAAPYHLAPHSFRTLWACLPILLAITIVLFFISPRIRPFSPPSKGVKQTASSQTKSQTGYSENISLQTMSDISKDNTPAFRLLNPPPLLTASQIRFRVSTLDQFDGWTWQRSTLLESKARPLVSKAGSPLLLSETQETPSEEMPHTSLEWYYIHLINYQERAIPLPETALFLMSFPDKFTFSSCQDGRILATESRLPKEFEILAMEDRENKYSPLMAAPPLESHLKVPEKLRASFEKKVQGLLSSSSGMTASRKAQHLVTWFRRQGQYSLDLEGVQEGPEGLRDFLETSMTGHCELFASAMALLLRCEGIPTRVVTGFAGAEEVPSLYGGKRNDFLIRNSNAHAWVEVYTESGVWKSYDPTPPEPVITIQAMENTKSPRQTGRNLTTAFDEYNYETQSRLYSSVLQSVTRWINEWEHGALITAWNNLKRNIKEPPIMILLAALVLFNLLAHFLYYKFAHPHHAQKISQKLKKRHPSIRPDLLIRILTILKADQTILLETSLSTPPGQTIQAAALAAGFPQEKAQQLARLYTTWRYRQKDRALEQEMMRLLKG